MSKNKRKIVDFLGELFRDFAYFLAMRKAEKIQKRIRKNRKKRG